MSTPRFAKVVLPIPIDRAFTYEIPEALADRAVVGARAHAPVRNRVETGFIIELCASSDVENPKPLEGIPDDSPPLSAEILALCRWMADYYCCSWGEALQCAAPPGVQARGQRVYTLRAEGLSPGNFTERQQAVLMELHRRGPLTEGQLARAVDPKGLGVVLRALVKRGAVLAERQAPRSRVRALTETWVRLAEEAALDAAGLEALQRRAKKQAAVYLDLLNGEPERAATELYEKHRVDAPVLRALEQRGLIERFQREFYRPPSGAAHGGEQEKHQLNEEQRTAYRAVVEALEAGRFQTFLLRGITGSGKTEVYLQIIERALELGRNAIILVPEISLTPQTVARFKGRFQENIAVLHSALGAGERFDEWRRAQRGDVRIVVGARSAIFAPLPAIGAVVVDEEHDTSYKQSETPRYHARDVAIMRAQANNAVCVLGSATPSVESYYNSERGKSIRLELTRRATEASLPRVAIIDMRTEAKELGANVILSRALEDAVKARLAQKQQVMLLLNRRGFAPTALCPQCGWVAQCLDCSVAMTYHAKGGFLACHYCGARRDVPQDCDECKFHTLLFLGAGTQKAEDLLRRSFPEARIERMDADTTSGRGGHAKILGRFAQGEIDILVGTQMIAKGHDFPGVTLVGVISADTGLALPDFRGAEHTFQLLTQVAGRAGRGAQAGEVFIQTYRPNHYAVMAAANHDYDAFFAKEIEIRETAGYPPFRRMANLMLESEDPRDVERSMGALHRMVRDAILEQEHYGMGILGPAPAAIPRVKKKYRWNLAILSKSAKRVNALARQVREAYEESEHAGRARLKIDLDPYGIY